MKSVSDKRMTKVANQKACGPVPTVARHHNRTREDDSERKIPPPTILVTAFGPFDGRSENASQLALTALKRATPSLRKRLLPVDSVVAPSRLKTAISELQPDLLILLGEAAGSSSIRIETTAWNLLDFTIPDNANRQPRNTPIETGAPTRLETELPLAPLLRHLNKQKLLVTLSSDPGRYLCNQIYYTARRKIDRAVFIHLPLARDLPTSQAVETLEIIIKHLVCQINP